MHLFFLIPNHLQQVFCMDDLEYMANIGLKATNSVIIFPPNLSFSNPIMFLFSPVGNGLLIS